MNSTEIKPIETSYAGCRFRSRLEARWAVFFDHVGLKWEYEPQGYELPSGGRYLPDFWLPESQFHVEVKGSEAALRAEGPRYAEAVLTGALPGNGLIFLGPVPDAAAGLPEHFVLTTHEHCCGRLILCLHIALGDWFTAEAKQSDAAELLPCTDLMTHLSDRLPPLGGYRNGADERATYTNCGPMPPDWPVDPPVAAAYTAARSARFEHGESGAPTVETAPTRAAAKVIDPFHHLRPLLTKLGIDFDTALERVLGHYDMNTAEGRVAALRATVPLVAKIADPSLRNTYAERLAADIDIDLEIVQKFIGGAK